MMRDIVEISDYEKTNFSPVIDKIKSLKNIKHDSELARILGIEQSTFSERRKRNSLPYKEIIDFAEKENISLDWLLNGRGDETDTDKTKLKHEYLLEILKELMIIKEPLNPEDLQICFVKTLAMEPPLLLDDFLIIVKNCHPQTHGDGIYKIKINNVEKIRRVHVLPGQKMKITADNWKEDTTIIDLDHHTDVKFIGKVVFFGRKIGNVK
jgi:transcriptional regulator with XRE-family HTH domain